MDKGRVYITVSGQHKGEVVRVRKASAQKVFFEYAQRFGTNQRSLIVQKRAVFEAHHRPA